MAQIYRDTQMVMQIDKERLKFYKCMFVITKLKVYNSSLGFIVRGH